MPNTTPTRRRTPKLAAALAASGLAIASLATAAAASPAHDSASAAASEQASLRQLKATARQVTEELVEGDTRVIGRNYGPGYVDHDTPDGNGTFGLAELTRRTRAQHHAHPDAETRIYRVIGQGNLVFVHSNLILDPGTRGFAVVDVYRFDQSRIVEHWAGHQAVPATTVSGNDMFSTLSSPRRLSPDPRVDPNASLQPLIGLFTAIVVTRDMSGIDVFFQLPYYQHSINTGNGPDALRQVWGPILLDPATHITGVNTIADGDLVATQNRLDRPSGSLLTFDISRVRNGKILEHWDVVQPLS